MAELIEAADYWRDGLLIHAADNIIHEFFRAANREAQRKLHHVDGAGIFLRHVHKIQHE